MWLRPFVGRLDHLGIKDRTLSFLRGEGTDFKFLPLPDTEENRFAISNSGR